MGSRYTFIVLYVWLESVLSRGDYRRADIPEDSARPAHAIGDLPPTQGSG
jgi:hypothetical protein